MAAGDEARRRLLERRIGRVRRRLNSERWLRELVVPLWAAVTAIALYRFFVRAYLPAFALVAFAAAFAVWALRARRRGIGFREAAVVADRMAGAGGLLLSRLEVPVGEWELSLNERVRALKLPEVSRRKPLAGCALALLFLAASLMVPLQKPPFQVNAAAASKLAQIEAKAEALANEEPLDESLEAELARLREELAEHRFDAADWEAADGVESALEQKAAEAASELSRAAEAAAALEKALAQAESADAAQREREELERALMELSDGTAESGASALEQALRNAGDGSDNEGDDQGEGKGEGKQGQGSEAQARSSQSGSSVSADRVSELRRALKERQEKLAKAYGEQRGQTAARPSSRERQRPCQGGQGQSAGQCSGQGQAQGQGQGQGSELSQGEGHASRHVSGAPSRGPGEGKLTFGDWAEMNPDRLAFAPLPKGEGGEAQELWGLKAADPERSSEPSRATGTGQVASGEQAPSHKSGPQLPRNQELIRRYFER